MRKIMFRVFDKEEGRFRRFDGLHDTMMMGRDGEASYYNLQNGSGGDEYIIEQFTGITDSKGAKIFEGDIIVLDANGDTGIITWNSTYLAWVVSEEEFLHEVNHAYTKVVGNIHDNPELLEVKDLEAVVLEWKV